MASALITPRIHFSDYSTNFSICETDGKLVYLPQGLPHYSKCARIGLRKHRNIRTPVIAKFRGRLGKIHFADDLLGSP